MSLSGASVILYPGVLRMAAKKLGGICSSFHASIHEVIIMRWENGAEYDEITEIVKEIIYGISDRIYKMEMMGKRKDALSIMPCR